MKRVIALLVISTIIITAGSAFAANKKSEDADHPMDTPLFMPFYLIDKLLTPPADYDKQWHTTIEQSMEDDYLTAKAKAGR